MAIKIKQREQKWVIEIENEFWQFMTRKDMEAGLKQLLDLKEKKGNVKEKEK